MYVSFHTYIHTLCVYACIILIMHMYAFVCKVYICYIHTYLYCILNKHTICKKTKQETDIGMMMCKCSSVSPFADLRDHHHNQDMDLCPQKSPLCYFFVVPATLLPSTMLDPWLLVSFPSACFCHFNSVIWLEWHSVWPCKFNLFHSA